MLLRMREVVTSVRLVFLVIAVTELQTNSFTTATTTELPAIIDQTSTASESQVTTTLESQETTEPTFTSSEPQVSTGTTSSLSEPQETTEPTFTSSEPHLSTETTSSLSEPQMTTESTFTSSEPQVSTGTTSSLSEEQMTTGTISASSEPLVTTGTTSTTEIQSNFTTSPLTIYTATNSTASWTTFPITNFSTAFSTIYPESNSTTTIYTTETQNNFTILSTTETHYNYTSVPATTYTNSTTLSLTTYPTTNYTTTSSTTYATTNSTSTSSTTYPTTNSATTSSTSIKMTTTSFLDGVAFEYGTAKGDSVFTNIDDACIPEVRSSLRFPIYGVFYSTMYWVNLNVTITEHSPSFPSLNCDHFAFRNCTSDRYVWWEFCNSGREVDSDTMILYCIKICITICSNGIVSFNERITTPGPPWDDIGLQSQGSYLAPYFNDLDFRRYWSSGVGAIYYHTYDIIQENSLKNNKNVIKARDYVRKYETDQGNFSPTFLLVVTWERASPYPVYSRQYESVSFQLALVTDGLNTFVLYIYFPGQMRLNYNHIFIGYSFINSGVFKKNVNSFTRGALSMDINAVTSGIRGFLYYRLTPVGFLVSNEQRVCRAWWSENRYLVWYNSWMNHIMPWCPCTLNLLYRDSSFGSYYFENSNIYCAVVQPRWWYSPHGKTCCYNLRTGQYQQTAPNAGGFLQYHKTLYPRQYQAVDQRMKEYCCYRTNLCHLYYDIRPVSSCYIRFPFFFAFFWGDPHIETLDKKKFTFNGWGEYTLVSLETTNTTFNLQSRTSRATKADGNKTDATIFSAFAAKDNLGANIHVELNESKDGLIIYAKSNENASSFDDFTIDFADMSKEFSVQDEYLSMSRDDASKTFTAVFSSGISLNISVGVQMLSVSVVLPTEFKGQPKGLLGNFDENPENDFRFPNGTELASNISERQIFDYGQTWEVIGNESVFRYLRGKNHLDFHHSEFIPKFLDEANSSKVNEAKKSCGDTNQECIFDLVFTENEAVANNTRNIENQALKGQSELENDVPQIIGNSTVYAYVQKNVTLNVNGSDNGSLSFKFLENTANASVRLINNDNRTVTGLLSFYLNDMNPVSVSLTVEDNHGVQAPALDLTILVCSGCSDHGNCSFTQEREDNRSTTHFKYVTCNCSPYWEGNDCEIDLDGCATRPCSSLRNCTDNPAPVHAMLNQTNNCSSCPTGYMDGVEDPAKCIDINECNATHGCNQTCVNTEGSYYCTCNSTFRIHSNGKDCQDIDECKEKTSGCDQECNNTYGGYICGCKRGYKYNNTEQACVQVNETICPHKNCSGAHGCTINEAGQEICFCRSGYQLTVTDLCEDVNECLQKICSQDCENIQGGYRCKCLQGYTLDTDKTSCISCVYPYYGDNCTRECACDRGAIRCDPLSGCVCESGWTGTNCDQDVNECSLNPNICNNILKICMNTMGSYTCSCVSGYQATNDTCTDVNECEDPTLNTCEQRCINSLGGFSCGCESGYNTDPGNSTKCIDIDECTARQSGCKQICENSPGRFSCSCYFGYDLTVDRKTCIEVENPCKKYANLTCDQICLVDLQARTATCSCNLGFQLAANNITCEDINECTENNGTLMNCSSSADCNNTNGSYVCSCKEGFKLENDGRTCSECDSFHYGTNCSKDCNCSVGVERCDKVTGCVCKSGWTGDKCDTDMNECSNNTLCTGSNIHCLNTPGSYQCSCESGYNKTNGSCIDIDECSDRTAFCSYECKNTNGSYECICMSGFKVNGSYCPDVNECLRSEDHCPQGCQNTEGSYQCVCYSGYEGNGTTCIPITGQSMTSIDIIFTFNIQVNGTLSMIDTYDKYLFDVNHTLYNYFDQNMKEYFISIENITLQEGSLIASFVLLIQDSTDAKTSLVIYLTDALNEQFVIFGSNVMLQSLAVGGYTVSSSGDLCAMYESLVGACPQRYKCTVHGGRPSCGPDDMEEDNKALVIGLSVGIPLGVILIAVVIVLVLKCKNNKIKDVTICGGRWPNREVLYPIEANRKLSGHSCNTLGFESDENEG